MAHNSSTALLAVAFLALSMAGCGEPTGPEALEAGTFRADLSGVVDTAVMGDADMVEGHLLFRGGEVDEIAQDVWALDLTVSSARFRAKILVVGGTEEPQEARYGVTAERPIPDDRALAQVEITRDDSTTFFVGRSGDVTIDRVNLREVFGSFALSFVDPADGGTTRLRAEGEFHGTR